MLRNPFTPTFGSPPPLLVGRGELIEDFGYALDDGPGAPGRATLYTGARGVGKTVMLNEAEDQAKQRGWLVVSETATPGLLERLTREHLPRLLSEVEAPRGGRKLTGFTVTGVGSVSWANGDRPEIEMGLRRQIEQLTELLAQRETGLLITVDEIHRHVAADMRAFGAIVQHAFREGRDLAFAGAGLPAAVSSLLADEVLTFLRRADRHHLGAVPVAEVAEAIRKPIEDAGKRISEVALGKAAQATGGYPFLIQLIGYHVWNKSRSSTEITDAAVDDAIVAARRRIGSLVLEPSLADISAVDRSFLVAMAADEGPSRLSDIAERLGVSSTYAGQYRLRLIQAELVEPLGRGELVFTMPYLRDYLLSHAAALGLPESQPGE